MKKLVIVCGTVLVMLMVVSVKGRRVDVGGVEGWNQGVNYTLWSSQQTVYIGDWLRFVFNKNLFDVLEVNETNYEKCNSENFIANITKGGRDVYQLSEARPYYFICSKGYCFSGMKLKLDVLEPPAPAPAPQGNYAVGRGGPNFMPILIFVLSLYIIVFA